MGLNYLMYHILLQTVCPYGAMIKIKLTVVDNDFINLKIPLSAVGASRL